MLNKVMSIICAVIMFIVPTANIPKFEAEAEKFKSNYTYVYVHGLGGWGEYDIADRVVPYWGTMGGSLMK